MRPALLATSLVTLCLAGVSAAAAATVSDPVGDIVPSYTGPALPALSDLDVTSFTVNFDGTNFGLSATMAAPISATSGFYVIGVNRGGAGASPFAGIGQPNVIFNSTIILNQNATGAVTVGGVTTGLAPGAVNVSGATISAVVPLSMLPSTGLLPGLYGFNFWPRSSAVTGVGAITDFAPNNANLSAAVPEPSAWAMMILGFGGLGLALRRRRSLSMRPLAA